tara:strand:- start:85 stop:513 length:429 start_codon:yes stop_codon:yes gene_type:complete
MKIKLIFLGKKKNNPINDLIEKYFLRIKKEISLELVYNSSFNKKTNSIVNDDDIVILLDEKGDEVNSKSFAKKLKSIISLSPKKIVFIVGDAYGFSDRLYKRSNYIISLSKLTFPHEVARLIIVEQLYRAITIIKNHPYHHE